MAHAKDTHHWGRETAKERYSGSASKSEGASGGGSKSAIIGLIDQPKLDEMGPEMQKPQAVNDWHDAGYDNDASGWVRGVGGGEAKPHFDHSKGKR